LRDFLAIWPGQRRSCGALLNQRSGLRRRPKTSERQCGECEKSALLNPATIEVAAESSPAQSACGSNEAKQCGRNSERSGALDDREELLAKHGRQDLAACVIHKAPHLVTGDSGRQCDDVGLSRDPEDKYGHD
jgi:hypothetical protein